jgi:hypothetical protein
LLASLTLVVVAILAIAVISLLLYVRHLKRTTIEPDNSAILKYFGPLDGWIRIIIGLNKVLC